MASDRYYATIRQIESGGNDLAFNKNSKAAGPFQFIPSTARAYGLSNPYDYDQSLAAVKRFTADNESVLRKGLGREPTEGELYLAHQQGAGGALKLLQNPNGNAAQTVGSKQVTQNGGTTSMTNAEFAGKWTGSYAQKAGTAGTGGVNAPSAGKTVDVDALGIAEGMVGISGGSGSVAQAIDRQSDIQKQAADTATAAKSAATSAVAGSFLDSMKDYAGRFIVVALGIVFVAGGVAMFASGNKTVQSAVGTVLPVAKAARVGKKAIGAAKAVAA